MHGLFEDLHHAVQDESVIIHDELTHIRDLVGDAFGQLTESFHGLTERTKRQRALILSVTEKVEAEAMSIDDGIAQSLKTITNLANEINDQVGAAVRALQFDDIVRQRLDNPFRHIDRLEQIVAILKDNDWDDPDIIEEATEPDYSVKLQERRSRLSQYIRDGERKESTRIEQPIMKAGSIDLF